MSQVGNFLRLQLVERCADPKRAVLELLGLERLPCRVTEGALALTRVHHFEPLGCFSVIVVVHESC